MDQLCDSGFTGYQKFRVSDLIGSLNNFRFWFDSKNIYLIQEPFFRIIVNNEYQLFLNFICKTYLVLIIL